MLHEGRERSQPLAATQLKGLENFSKAHISKTHRLSHAYFRAKSRCSLWTDATKKFVLLAHFKPRWLRGRHMQHALWMPRRERPIQEHHVNACVCAPRPSCVEEGETFFQTSWAERKTPCTVWEQLSCCLLLQKCAERVAEHRSWRAQTAIRSERIKDIVLIPSQSDRRLFVWRRCKTDRFSVCSYVTCKHELNKSGDANMPARWDELVRAQRLYPILCCLELLFFPAVSNEIFEFQILASWRLHWSLERHRRQKNLASRDPSVQFCASNMKTLVITADL